MNETKRISQYIDNASYNEDLEINENLVYGYDGTAARAIKTNADGKLQTTDNNQAVKVTESGSFTYIAVAPIGTAQATAGWQAYRVEVSGANTIITWADGNDNFDNVATDLTTLSYS